MGFFSFLSGADDCIRLALPAKDRADFLVYFKSPDGTPPPEAELVAAALSWLDERVDEPLRSRLRRTLDTAGLLIELHDVKDMPEPPAEILLHLSPPGWEFGLRASTHVAVITAVADASVPPMALLTALAAARGVALAVDGGILDPALPRFEDPASFEDRITADWRFVLSEHIVLPFSVDDRGRGWLTSLGLSRFALPEIEVRDVPPHLGRHLMPIINGLALRLVESASRAPVDGDERRVEIDTPQRVEWGNVAAALGADPARAEVDGDTRAAFEAPIVVGLEHRKRLRGHAFLRVVRPPGVKGSQEEWISSILAPLAGDDAVSKPGPQSEDAMILAHRRAIAELPRLREHFHGGLNVGEVFAVKKAFETDDGGPEYMWIVVQTWKGDTIHGVLANNPESVSALRVGQDITLAEADVYDWCLQAADGTMEGAFTDKVVMGG